MTFDIDANGIVNVSAKDKATNKEQQIRIQASGGLSDDDIDKMVQEAEANADSDKKKREAVEAKNQAESVLHSVENSLEELGSDIPADEKSPIEDAISELKTALEGEDAEDINAKTEALSQASMKLGEIAYRKAQEESADSDDNKDGDTAASPSDSSNDDAIDADFTDLEIEEESDDEEKSA